MAVASDPTKYCPDCYKKEIGRLMNHRSGNPHWATTKTAKLEQHATKYHVEDVD